MAKLCEGSGQWYRQHQPSARKLRKVRESSNKNIPRGCRTSYVCGLNDQSKDMYEDYLRRFAEHPFNEDTVRVGDALLDEISEAQRGKWKKMIESIDFTHSSRKAWKTINKLHRTSAAM